MKIRFLEPGNPPYQKSLKNYFVYDANIRTPSHGLLTLATIVNQTIADVRIYSESISNIIWDDVLDADFIFISIFSFQANRGYQLAKYIRQHSNASIVFGGLHATLCYEEASKYGDYVLVGEGDEQILQFIDCLTNHNALNCKGVAYQKDGVLYFTGNPQPPRNIDIVPDRNLLYRYKKMAGHNTIWPQVQASRGCPHNCDYCCLVHAFGREVRTRAPEAVMKDIQAAIAFHDEGHHRLAKLLWITDDNFFANRKWAIQVLQKLIDSGIHYQFTIQARYEVGFDDEMLNLLKKAGFIEIAMGIEFLEDEAFQTYHKESSYTKVLQSVKNIQRHGLRVRGLFIVGADNHTVGIGEKLANFVMQNQIAGVLIQSMYFIPGTPVYETHKERLLHHDWSKCTGNVVHYPERITPSQLQKEIMIASKRIYSVRRLLHAVFCQRDLDRILFIGEYFWQKSVRRELKRELPHIKKCEKEMQTYQARENKKQPEKLS